MGTQLTPLSALLLDTFELADTRRSLDTHADKILRSYYVKVISITQLFEASLSSNAYCVEG